MTHFQTLNHRPIRERETQTLLFFWCGIQVEHEHPSLFWIDILTALTRQRQFATGNQSYTHCDIYFDM
jgi:hypothetical protein